MLYISLWGQYNARFLPLAFVMHCTHTHHTSNSDISILNSHISIQTSHFSIHTSQLRYLTSQSHTTHLTSQFRHLTSCIKLSLTAFSGSVRWLQRFVPLIWYYEIKSVFATFRIISPTLKKFTINLTTTVTWQRRNANLYFIQEILIYLGIFLTLRH